MNNKKAKQYSHRMLKELRKNLIDGSEKLQDVPTFKPYDVVALLMSSQGLKPTKESITIEEQKKSYIKNRLVYALGCTLETPKKSLKQHAKDYQKIFKNDNEVQKALQVIVNNI